MEFRTENSETGNDLIHRLALFLFRLALLFFLLTLRSVCLTDNTISVISSDSLLEYAHQDTDTCPSVRGAHLCGGFGEVAQAWLRVDEAREVEHRQRVEIERHARELELEPLGRALRRLARHARHRALQLRVQRGALVARQQCLSYTDIFRMVVTISTLLTL